MFKPGIHNCSPDAASSLKNLIGKSDCVFVYSVDMFKWEKFNLELGIHLLNQIIPVYLWIPPLDHATEKMPNNSYHTAYSVGSNYSMTLQTTSKDYSLDAVSSAVSVCGPCSMEMGANRLRCLEYHFESIK